MGKYDLYISRALSNAYSEVAAHAGTFGGKPEFEALMLLASLTEHAAADHTVYLTMPDGSCEVIDLKDLLPITPGEDEEVFPLRLFYDTETGLDIDPLTHSVGGKLLWKDLYLVACHVSDEMGEPIARVILAAIGAAHHAQLFNAQLRATPPAGFLQA